MIADLRADNRRLREELGERPAAVTDLAERRGRCWLASASAVVAGLAPQFAPAGL